MGPALAAFLNFLQCLGMDALLLPAIPEFKGHPGKVFRRFIEKHIFPSLKQRIANQIAFRLFLSSWLFAAILFSFSDFHPAWTQVPRQWTSAMSELFIPTLIAWFGLWIFLLFLEILLGSQSTVYHLFTYLQNPHETRNPIHGLMEQIFRPVSLITTGESSSQAIPDFIDLLRNGRNPAESGANAQTLFNALEHPKDQLDTQILQTVFTQPNPLQGFRNLLLTLVSLFGIGAGLHLLLLNLH